MNNQHIYSSTKEYIIILENKRFFHDTCNKYYNVRFQDFNFEHGYYNKNIYPIKYLHILLSEDIINYLNYKLQ